MSDPTRPIVTDASTVLDFLLQLRNAEHIGDIFGQPHVALHAPDTLDREVVSVLRGRARAGHLKPDDAEEVIEDFRALPIEPYASRPYLHRVWALWVFSPWEMHTTSHLRRRWCHPHDV